jgi:hypothetical protein
MGRESILYLYAELAGRGFSHVRCRKLIDALKTQYSVELKYAILPYSDFAKSDESIKREVVSESDLLNGQYRVLVIEGRLGSVENAEESEKVRASAIREFKENGGIVIFLMNDVNNAINNSSYNAFLRNSGLPSLRNPRSEWEFPDIHLVSGESYKRGIIFGYDEKHALEGGHFFSVDITRDCLSLIDHTLRPAFDGISRIVVDHPIQLDGYKMLLAVPVGGKNNSTRMITSGDLWWDGDPYHIFGACDDTGRGVSATITGGICLDKFQDYHTDANGFVLNLVNLFVQYQNMRSPFLRFSETVQRIKKIAAPELAQASEREDRESIYDKVAEEISKAISEKIRNTPREARQKAAQFVKSRLSECWKGIEEIHTFLISGETCYQLMRPLGSTPGFDFSAVSVLFAKAIEVEVTTRLLGRFREGLKMNGRLTQVIRDDRRVKGKNERLFDYLKEEKRITLGDVNFYLGCVESSDDPILSEFRDFLQTSKNPDFWTSKDAFPKTLDYVTKNFRNGSVHTEQMTLEKCEELRMIVFGLDDQESLILQINKNLPS